ncbi:universal stress protein [Amycolatopsis sp.]|uniref:universal stress protein n=1 Tax=Amycolatopsis sp. TaxID=37632 RepID=UPI002C4FED65|nr:universal stress protein [Amycolatopsis sp.]HVV14755.1 universal stress protein [Amycolatopsis sp.]
MTGIVPRHSILTGVDGSPEALHAARWAAREAARRHVPLRLCHVRGPGPGDAERGNGWLRAAEWAARDLAPGIELHRLCVAGDVPAILLRESGTAGLTVLGAGPVAVAVAARATGPVVVVRGRKPGEPPPDGGPVVAGVGAGKALAAVVEFAVGEALLRDVPLVAVHAWADPAVGESWSVPPFDVDYDGAAADAGAALAARMSGWHEKYPDAEIRHRVPCATPAHGLLTEAAGAQLVVVGAGTASGLGDTVRALLHHGSAPVAVVRAGG